MAGPRRACRCPTACSGRRPAHRGDGNPRPFGARLGPRPADREPGPTDCGCRFLYSDNRPDQHAIHTAVALVDIAQVAIDRILSGGRIVEIALLGHHLRLNKIALRPEEFGTPVFDIVVAHADEALAPPLAQVAEPGLVFAASCDLPLAQFRYPIGNGSPVGTRYLTPIRRIPRILCHYAQGCREENADDASHHRRTYHGGAAGD